jgi:hypothetical protein
MLDAVNKVLESETPTQKQVQNTEQQILSERAGREDDEHGGGPTPHQNPDKGWKPRKVSMKKESGEMKEGILKSIKRGMQGWGGVQGKPKDVVQRTKDLSNNRLTDLKYARNASGPASPHSPQDLQNRVHDREMKKRNLKTESGEMKESSPFDWKGKPSELKKKPGETAGFDSKKISTGTVYSRKPVKDTDPVKKEDKTFASFKSKLNEKKEETDIDMGDESCMSDKQKSKRDKIVASMKDKESDFRAKYGKNWKNVMYATATKLAMNEDYVVEDVEQIEELSKDTLHSYNNKSDADASKKHKELGSQIKAGNAPAANKTAGKIQRRLSGMDRAETRLNKEETTPVEEQTSDVNKRWTDTLRGREEGGKDNEHFSYKIHVGAGGPKKEGHPPAGVKKIKGAPIKGVDSNDGVDYTSKTMKREDISPLARVKEVSKIAHSKLKKETLNTKE